LPQQSDDTVASRNSPWISVGSSKQIEPFVLMILRVCEKCINVKLMKGILARLWKRVVVARNHDKVVA
jgi:hypothetical protein